MVDGAGAIRSGTPRRDSLSLAFATDPAISRAKRLDRRTEWLKALLKALSATRHIGPRLGGAPFRPGPLVVRAAPVSQLDRPCEGRWTAVGDAAAVFDPLGLEGIYKALENGIRVAQVIRAKLRHKQDLSAARIAANTEDHLALRDHFYALEQQWPESVFWATRLRTQRRGSPPARCSAVLRRKKRRRKKGGDGATTLWHPASRPTTVHIAGPVSWGG
jgi:flavin-dependent dehydrogenase